jgi:ribose transport system permease protein
MNIAARNTPTSSGHRKSFHDAAVIGGVSILGGRGHYLGTLAGSITLVAPVSVLLAENMPDWGRSVVYGGAILLILLTYGRERQQL